MKVIMSGLALCMMLAAGAQQEKMDHPRDRKDRWHGKMERMMPSVSRSAGVVFQQFDGLNARVANLPQYKQLRDHAGMLALGWMNEQHRFVTMGDLAIGSSMSGHRDEKSSTYRFLSIGANLGYDVLKSRSISLYPFGGLAFQWYQALFYKDNSAVSFDNVLQSPTVQNNIQSVRFNNAYFVYRGGLGISFKSPKDPSNSIGFQAGYTGSFKKHAWRSNEGQTLANAPVDGISQFFVSLVLTSKPWMMMRH